MIQLLFTFVITSICAAQPISFSGSDLVSGQELKFDGKGMVIAFLSAKCPCSNDHVGELAELKKSFPGYKFVGIHSNADETLAEAKTYFAKIGLPFPVIQDDGAKIADQFKAFKTPHVFVINELGEAVYQGGVTDSKKFQRAERKYLREALNDLKNHQSVKTAEARTLGCAISRK